LIFGPRFQELRIAEEACLRLISHSRDFVLFRQFRNPRSAISALMTIVVPKVAGVPRVVAAAPPQKGSTTMNQVQLLAMARSGADEIFILGGVQALGALAFGIEDSPPLDPVDMIVGPGNAYVAEAKRQLYGRVGNDIQAKPTEILVLADSSADPLLFTVIKASEQTMFCRPVERLGTPEVSG
jgi:hypothetical protein